MKTKALARDERKRMVILAFAVEVQNGNAGEMTMAQIARKIGLAPSTKLREMILEMVIDGQLDYRDEPMPGVAKFRRIYAPNFKQDKVYEAIHLKRKPIKVNSRQKTLELPWD